jgi:hypothetical protein
MWSQIIKNETVVGYTSRENIKWNFIPERAPWMGGYYERLVRLVKQCIRKSIAKICLTFLQLQTLTVEVEAIVNSRPLVYVGSDFDAGQILTPAHFLTINTKTGLPDVNNDNVTDFDYVKKLSSADKLIDYCKKGQKYLQHFWKLWQEEYLLSLREKSQRFLKQPRCSFAKKPAVGDVVLVHDNTPKGTWKIAKLTEVIISFDGCIRTARVTTSNGTILTRALLHLYPLECVENSDESLRVDIPSVPTKPIDVIRRNLERIKAIKARVKIRKIAEELLK